MFCTVSSTQEEKGELLEVKKLNAWTLFDLKMICYISNLNIKNREIIVCLKGGKNQWMAG